MKVLVLILCVFAPLVITPATAYTPPRLADGKPDLNGIWEVRSKIDRDIEGAGVIVDPKSGKIPYTSEALSRKKENSQDRAAGDPVSKCKMPGVPRLMYISY